MNSNISYDYIQSYFNSYPNPYFIPSQQKVYMDFLFFPPYSILYLKFQYFKSIFRNSAKIQSLWFCSPCMQDFFNYMNIAIYIK